jgi:sulfur-carrier protein
MPAVRFTRNLQRHVSCPPGEHAGATVRDVLEAYFAANPGVRHYVVDDQGAVRPHVAVFVGSQTVQDRVGLTDAVVERDEIYVMQALSGGAQ